MKGRKRGCFLPLTFILLFVCIAGHAADDSEDGEEEDVLGKTLQKTISNLKKKNKTIKQKKNTMIKCTVDVNFQGNLEVELSVKQW